MWEFSVCGLGVRKKYDIKKKKNLCTKPANTG